VSQQPSTTINDAWSKLTMTWPSCITHNLGIGTFPFADFQYS
jgi:hypothetical protein